MGTWLESRRSADSWKKIINSFPISENKLFKIMSHDFLTMLHICVNLCLFLVGFLFSFTFWTIANNQVVVF